MFKVMRLGEMSEWVTDDSKELSIKDWILWHINFWWSGRGGEEERSGEGEVKKNQVSVVYQTYVNQDFQALSQILFIYQVWWEWKLDP